MKEQIKVPKTELSHKEIANISDVEFKTLVIRILTKMVEYGCKIEGKMKATKSKIKKRDKEPTMKGRKRGLKSTVWTTRKKNIQPEQNEETRIQKNDERPTNLWDNFINVATSKS